MNSPRITASPTGALRELARSLRAEGRDIADLTAGELATPTPPHIVEAAVAAARDPARHGYGSAAGDPALRDAVADWAGRSLGIAVDRTQVAITNGAKQALHNALRTLSGHGDEVIVPAPYWVTFPEAVRLSGAVPVVAHPRQGNGLPDVADLEAVRTGATRAVIICSPHNPTGLVHDEAQLEAIARWAAAHHIWIISDDTYRDLTFVRTRSTPEFARTAGCDVVSIGSTSKSHAMTGWRTGWLIAPAEVTATATAIQSHTTSNVGRVAQAAALAALTGPDVAARTSRRLVDLRDELVGILQDAGIPIRPPQGAFYLFPSMPGTDRDDVALARTLLEDAGVAVVPGTAFGMPGHVRVSYAGAPEAVADGVRRLATAMGSR
ncbi:pyridoxal phosphate-dependent aminotransferase [Marinactinospora rubrisoli]|uniref:Pyridoxal phosphate-dependent aminotransferase n=1 Tax=Marinactinospora rubrisoli TaxID=2715399 RepID=A0ABW2KEB6_9ACTN